MTTLPRNAIHQLVAALACSFLKLGIAHAVRGAELAGQVAKLHVWH